MYKFEENKWYAVDRYTTYVLQILYKALENDIKYVILEGRDKTLQADNIKMMLEERNPYTRIRCFGYIVKRNCYDEKIIYIHANL